ncbi:hypothetical protein IFM89_024740, partial [Coptis chinensis]
MLSIVLKVQKKKSERCSIRLSFQFLPMIPLWVAMVPSPDSSQQPCFPECLNWLLENQVRDGSWTLPHHHHLLIKESMLSTLACVLALRRWETGDEHVRKGLEFMELNFGLIMDKKHASPIGFDIIFPGMIEYAKDLDLNLPFSPKFVEAMLHKRDLEFERVSKINSKGSKAYLAYTSEGLTKLCDWKEVMKWQRKNGSMFNSPSTTAATFIQNQDAKCLEYLRLLLKTFANAVPTSYPVDVYIHLSMVDRLERMGIGRHFRNEIRSVLDETYRCWLRREEEIFLDIETCAMAFRLLRTNGFVVSSDTLAEFNEEKDFFTSAGGNIKGIHTVLELYKTSQIMILPNEPVLEILNSWTSQLLKQNLANGVIHDGNCQKEVVNSLKFTYDADVERLENRRNIECYNVDSLWVLKASYRCSNIDNRDIVQFGVEDYNFCQGILQKELANLERWVKENRLDQLKFARLKLEYLYFSVAGILFSPELSDARMSWTKNSFLSTVVDDFFDVKGSREELVNLINLVEKWERDTATDYSSEQVEIIFLAIQKTINDLGDIAFTRQGRNIERHMIDLWLSLLNSMMKEYEWVRDKSAPKVEEYIETASISFTLGPVVLVTQYFLGPKLSEEVITSPEYNDLFKHTNICCRLLNDVQTFKREGEQGKLNSVLLCKIHSPEAITEQQAVREIQSIIDRNRRELLGLVLDTKGSIVPKACKDLFWNTFRVTHLFYRKKDGFSSPLEMDVLNGEMIVSLMVYSIWVLSIVKQKKRENGYNPEHKYE